MGKITDIGKTRQRGKSERERWYNSALMIIQSDKRILFMRDVIDMLPIGHTKFYELFPTGSPELINLQKFLDGNRVTQRLQLREEMVQMRSPQTILAIYKAIATPEERKLLWSSMQPEEAKEEAKEEKKGNDIQSYKDRVKGMLEDSNRYSPMLDIEIAAMASAWSTLDQLEREKANLDSPFLVEVTTQGKKTVPHPVYSMQQKALESMSRHAKLLGIDFESVPVAANDGPLATLTKEIIGYAQGQPGRMTVGKEGKRRKNGEKKTKNRRKEED